MNLIVHKYGLVLSITINFRKIEYNEPHNAIDSAESQYMATLVPKSHLCLCIKKAVTLWRVLHLACTCIFWCVFLVLFRAGRSFGRPMPVSFYVILFLKKYTDGIFFKLMQSYFLNSVPQKFPYSLETIISCHSLLIYSSLDFPSLGISFLFPVQRDEDTQSFVHGGHLTSLMKCVEWMLVLLLLTAICICLVGWIHI